MVRRRFFVLATLALGLVAIAALAPSALGTSNGSTATNAKYTVTMTDFKFRISPARITAGTHTFVVINRGRATHDFKLAGKKTRVLDPGQRQTIKIRVKKGNYQAVCTVPGHAALGMKARVTVR